MRKKIVIVASDRDLVRELGLQCHQLGFQVHRAYDPRTALTLVQQHAPSLVCMEPDRGDDPRLDQMLDEDASLSEIPVIVLERGNNHAPAPKYQSLLAYYIRRRADVWSQIEPVIQELVILEPQTSSAAQHQ